MPYYPVFLDVETKPVLVIGGGTVGLEKVRGLIKAGAQVTVVSPQLEPTLASWRAEGKIQYLAREYAEGDMDGFVFVMAATDDGAVNAAVSAEGRRRGVWVNAADDPAHCDFILPSVVRQGPVTIAVSTGGGSPAMARRVREELTDYFTPDFAPLAELLTDVRADLKQRGALRPISQDTWQTAVDGQLRALLAQRRRGQAKALLLARLGAPLTADGKPEALADVLRRPLAGSHS